MDSRKGSDDERRENEDEDVEGSLQTLGLAPYQFEPVAPANESSLSNRLDEDDEREVPTMPTPRECVCCREIPKVEEMDVVSDGACVIRDRA